MNARLSHRRIAPCRHDAGFTLIETLLAALILGVALLAIAQLQTTATLVEIEAYQRSQAMVLANDMISRINANRANVAQYSDSASLDTPLGRGDSQPQTCTGTGSGRDLCEWSNALKGTAVTDSNGTPTAIRDARGCVVAAPAAGEYWVIVAWATTSKTSTAPASSCGQGLYADDAYRRVLVQIVRIATLNNLT